MQRDLRRSKRGAAKTKVEDNMMKNATASVRSYRSPRQHAPNRATIRAAIPQTALQSEQPRLKTWHNPLRQASKRATIRVVPPQTAVTIRAAIRAALSCDQTVKLYPFNLVICSVPNTNMGSCQK